MPTAATPSHKTKKSDQLSLRDRLSRLGHQQACKLLGNEGARLIQRGGAYEVENLEEQVYLAGDLFRLRLDDAVVTITLMAAAK